ncbi:RICIN domain-containing protein [Streptomyces sp. NPDC005970]|uniref:RICIN domain-containing protein n=1 Tax=Streptomyces sp. NPDC005970 TaxID=3156723 RepID=UPI0033D7CA15
MTSTLRAGLFSIKIVHLRCRSAADIGGLSADKGGFMGRSGRPFEGLRGESEHINALAGMLCRLTEGLTLRELAERYPQGGGKTLWGQYRSGERPVPAHVLHEVINRQVPDARTRQQRHEEAKRLYELVAQKQQRQAPVSKTQQAVEKAVQAQTQAETDLVEAEERIRSLVEVIHRLERGKTQDPTADSDAGEELRQAKESLTIAEEAKSDALQARNAALEDQEKYLHSDAGPRAPQQASSGADRPPAGVGSPATGSTGRTGDRRDRFRRWRTPAQWGALAALLAGMWFVTDSQNTATSGAPPTTSATPTITTPHSPTPGPSARSSDPFTGPSGGTSRPAHTATPSKPQTPSAPSATPSPGRKPRTRADAPPLPKGLFRLTNADSHLCLSVPPENTTPSAGLIQTGCDASHEQFWKLSAEDTGSAGTTYSIRNQHSGLCLSVDAARKENDAIITQYLCGDDEQDLFPDQLWSFRYDTSRHAWKLISRNSGKCVALPTASGDEEQVLQEECGGDSWTLWRT